MVRSVLEQRLEIAHEALREAVGEAVLKLILTKGYAVAGDPPAPQRRAPEPERTAVPQGELFGTPAA